MDDDYVLMSKLDFDLLPDYTNSEPTGKYNGKMWKGQFDGEWEAKALVYYDTVAWMPIPSFDDILEANRDVLERIKEKGD